MSRVPTQPTYPVWLGCSPLDLVDLALCCRVGEDRVLDGPGHLLNVPDEGLVVVARSADVAGGVRRPRDTVHACAVVVQPATYEKSKTNVHNVHIIWVKKNCYRYRYRYYFNF